MEILHGVSVSAFEGEIVAAIIGRTGSGKSTLMKVLCGLIRPTNGVIQPVDIEITSRSLRS